MFGLPSLVFLPIPPHPTETQQAERHLAERSGRGPPPPPGSPAPARRGCHLRSPARLGSRMDRSSLLQSVSGSRASAAAGLRFLRARLRRLRRAAAMNLRDSAACAVPRPRTSAASARDFATCPAPRPQAPPAARAPASALAGPPAGGAAAVVLLSPSATFSQSAGKACAAAKSVCRTAYACEFEALAALVKELCVRTCERGRWLAALQLWCTPCSPWFFIVKNKNHHGFGLIWGTITHQFGSVWIMSICRLIRLVQRGSCVFTV